MNLFLAPWAHSTMHYNYFLELASLIILVAISVCYYTRKKFPSPLFKLFGYCLLFVTINVFLNVATCWVMDNSKNISVNFIGVLNAFYYSSSVFLSYLFFSYVFYALGKSFRFAPLYNLTALPSVLAIIFTCTNGIHHLVYTFNVGEDGLIFLSHGPAFFVLYIVTGLNILATFVYIFVFRHRLTKKLISVLVSIIIVILAANVIQYFQPHYLLTGVGYTLSMMFTIITVNDPDEKVDRTSGAFNNEAFIELLNTQRFEKQRKFYVIFDIESTSMFISTFGPIYYNELLSQIRKFVEIINPLCDIFRTQSNRFVLMFKTKEEQLAAIDLIKERMEHPFVIQHNEIMISIRLFYFKNEGVFKNMDSYNDFLNRTLSTLNFKDNNYIQLDKMFVNRINRDKRIKEILEDSLKKKSGGFYMVYQPIYDMNKKKFNHFEALIRLVNDELGYIGPAEFIPIAESFGLASEIDNFVLNETCAFLKRNPQIEHLEINVSCAEFFNNPSERFLKTIKKYGVDPSRICLEITETVAVKYPTKTKEFMEDLGQYGIEFAMDDFGSGYSNIARFITMPFSIAKLDKTLLGQERNIKIFLDSAVSLFKNLDIPIVIEGVETEKQLKVAKTNDINYVQGFYFSRPLKEEDLVKFLKTHEA